MKGNIAAFFALVKAGLWEQDVRLLRFGDIDFDVVYRLAEEQSVLGVVAAGLEHVVDVQVPKPVRRSFMGDVLQLEEANASMNLFIADLLTRMRGAGIYALLVKGQGVALCYERPLWRGCGDVDLFLDAANYEKAKAFVTPLASSVELEGTSSLHYGVTIDKWVVELHGTLRCGLSSRMDRVIDAVQRDTFENGQIRIWVNCGVDVPLPSVDNDIILIFTHFLKHFYKGGLGIRQICDWCRLLWTYRNQVDVVMLEKRLRSMGLMSEWKAFGAYVVEWLGMPVEALPLYSPDDRWRRKAARIQSFILMSGNFGHNRDFSYFEKYPYIIRKFISMCRRIGDLIRHASIFPLDSLRFFPKIMFNGLRSAARGE